MFYLIAGVGLVLIGGVVSIIFWVPKIIDRKKLKDLLGTRYPFVYLVYSANGPVLLIAGFLLVAKYFSLF